jgi:hypothetical protein
MVNRHRYSHNAFTLIEIIGSVSAFTIAFLAGTSAFAILLKHQMISTQRSISAAAAMFIMDWHAKKEVSAVGSGLVVNISDLLYAIPGRETVKLNGNINYFGGDADDDDRIMLFKSNGIPGISEKELLLYDDIFITLSSRSTAECASPDGNRSINWREMTMWSGSKKRISGFEDTNVQFLSRYLIPEIK